MKSWFGWKQEGVEAQVYEGKVHFLTVATIIGVFVSIMYATWEWQHGNHSRALANLIFPFTAPFIIYYLRRKPRAYHFILHLLALMVFIAHTSAAFYLANIHHMIWYPTYPLIYFYVLGHRGLSWALVLFFLTWGIYFLYPYLGDEPAITLYAMTNTMVAYLLTTLLSWMNSREVLFYQRSITQRAHYDFLTGVYNRVAWMEYAKQELVGLSRGPQRCVSVIMLDIDDFKQVNDRYGHHVGDQVLLMVCEKLSGRLRKSDVFGRWGGEEFVVLLPDTTLAQAVEVAESLRKTLLAADANGKQVSASFGVAEYSKGDSLDSIMRRADERLYQAKFAGKNRVIA